MWHQENKAALQVAHEAQNVYPAWNRVDALLAHMPNFQQKILPDPPKPTVCRDKHQPQMCVNFGNCWRLKAAGGPVAMEREGSKRAHTENSAEGKTKGSENANHSDNGKSSANKGRMRGWGCSAVWTQRGEWEPGSYGTGNREENPEDAS